MTSVAGGRDFPAGPRGPGNVLSTITPSSDTKTGVKLLRHDAELRAAVDPGELPLAERALTVRRLDLAPGVQTSDYARGAGELAVLLEGVLVLEVHLAGRTSAQMLGPGAILHDLATTDSSLPCSMSLTGLGSCVVGVLDDRFTLAARRWPALWQVVHERLTVQLKTSARWSAVAALPRVEQRVLAAFWLIADEWGTRRPDGIAIDLPLTHRFIGTMVAARRPTVSLALSELAGRGVLTATTRGHWLLAPGSVAELTG